MYLLRYNIKYMKIEVYEAASGKRQFEDWLKKLDRGIRSKVRMRLDRLVLGNFGDCKSIANGVFELRIHFHSGIRIYYSKIGNTIVLLLCGDKSTQKKDIKKALVYWKDYLLR